MTTRTEEAQTIHGSIEYEVVECDSCGQTTRKENAKRFIIGDIEKTTGILYSSGGYRVTGKTADGWACETCYNEGPIRFPQLTQRERFKQALDWWFNDDYGLRFRGLVTLAFFAFVGLILLLSGLVVIV